MVWEKTRVFNIPNSLTLSRLILLPLFFWLMAQDDRTYWTWGGILIAYGILSDNLDGYIARRFHQTTTLGKVLDPLADKITAGSVAVFCIVERGLPWLAVVLTVVRDLGLLLGGRFLWRQSGAIPTSNTIGKAAALFWGITLLIWTFDWHPISRIVLWPVVGLYLFAGVIYAYRTVQWSRKSDAKSV